MPPSSSGSDDERTANPGILASVVICHLYTSFAMSSETRREIGMIDEKRSMNLAKSNSACSSCGATAFGA